MGTYELLCRTNWALWEGRTLSEGERRQVIHTLLTAVDPPNAVRRFHRGVRAWGEHRPMYPLFYTPPYNCGNKLRLVTGDLPKTHLLSANHYELEILRLLALWIPNRVQVRKMVDATLYRLDRTCFGHFCGLGECVGSAVAVLRFLSAVRPGDDPWITEIVKPLGELFAGAKGWAGTHKNLPIFYFCLALSELDSERAEEIIREREAYLLELLQRGWLTGRTGLGRRSVVRKQIILNTLARIPRYEYLKYTQSRFQLSVSSPQLTCRALAIADS